jgi:DNA helicase-2/ATP-dependent DNA helicase PcrA
LNVSSLDRPRNNPTEYFKDLHHHMIRRDGIDPTTRERGVPRPPDDAVMLPTTFSDLTYWRRCPREYQLRSLMGFGPGVGEQYGYGQQLHNILAEIHTRAREGKTLDIAAVEKLVQERFHLRYTKGPPLDALRLAATMALSRYVRDNASALQRTQAVEKPFEFIDKASGALITGVVDLLEKIEGVTATDPHRQAVGIVDFKAHKVRTLEEFEHLKEQAERQLRLYASAVHYAFPYEPASATVQLITPSAPVAELAAQGVVDQIAVDVSETQRDRALEEVRVSVSDIKESIKTGCFAKSGATNNWCRQCDFRTFCPGYSEWRRRDEKSPTPLTPLEMREAEVDSVMEEQNARPTSE